MINYRNKYYRCNHSWRVNWTKMGKDKDRLGRWYLVFEDFIWVLLGRINSQRILSKCYKLFVIREENYDNTWMFSNVRSTKEWKQHRKKNLNDLLILLIKFHTQKFYNHCLDICSNLMKVNWKFIVVALVWRFIRHMSPLKLKIVLITWSGKLKKVGMGWRLKCKKCRKIK